MYSHSTVRVNVFWQIKQMQALAKQIIIINRKVIVYD